MKTNKGLVKLFIELENKTPLKIIPRAETDFH